MFIFESMGRISVDVRDAGRLRIVGADSTQMMSAARVFAYKACQEVGPKMARERGLP